MYDLAVYLPGGAVILVLTKAAMAAIFGLDFPMAGVVQNGSADSIGIIIRAVIWLSASYLAGHLASFISTYIIEKPVHHYFGYPSSVWLQFEENARKGVLIEAVKDIMRNNFKKSLAITKKDIVQIIVLLFQIPAFIWFSIVFWRGAFGFYAQKLPLGIISKVRSKFRGIGINIPIESGSRWEKIIEHHVANNCPLAYNRMYNYLVIYGALRLLSLIMISICWFIIIFSIKNKFTSGDITIEWGLVIIWLFASVAYTMSVMAFAKFNRRYFEETIMALLLAKQ